MNQMKSSYSRKDSKSKSLKHSVQIPLQTPPPPFPRHHLIIIPFITIFAFIIIQTLGSCLTFYSDMGSRCTQKKMCRDGEEGEEEEIEAEGGEMDQ